MRKHVYTEFHESRHVTYEGQIKAIKIGSEKDQDLVYEEHTVRKKAATCYKRAKVNLLCGMQTRN